MQWNPVAFLLNLSLALLILDVCSIQQHEAKKIKLKDVKKLKKYALLLAGQRKILYAIPFPVPLPVFVKRQQIYTHVPIIPRYVQQPYYPLAAAYGQQMDAYASMNENTYSSASNHARPEAGERQREREQETRKPEQPTHGQLLPGPKARGAKYLATRLVKTVATGSPYPLEFQALGGNSGSSKTKKRLVGGLMGGQAKLMTPSAFISSLKPGSGALQIYSGKASGEQQLSHSEPKFTTKELDYVGPTVRAPRMAALQPPALYRLPIPPAPYLAYPAAAAAAYLAGPGVGAMPFIPAPAEALLEQADSSQALETFPARAIVASPAARPQLHEALTEARSRQLEVARILAEQARLKHELIQAQSLSSGAPIGDEAHIAESSPQALRVHSLAGLPLQLRVLNF